MSYEFLKSILDTIIDNIAVTDQSGTIVFVNKSWIEFGLRNGIPETKNWIGSNYFRVCSPTINNQDTQCLDIIDGFRKILNYQQKEVHFEYPCHSPQEKRWFLMRITSFQLKDQRFIVMSHTDITQRKLAQEHIIHISHVDDLTKLYNRRYFNEFFTNEWKRCIRGQNPISLALADIDYFKRLNDTFGHNAGDGCLKTISEIMERHTQRPSDLCARYGGDEFVILHGNSTLDESMTPIKKLANEITKCEIPNPESPIRSFVSVSIGLATTFPKANSNKEDFIKAADKLLYSAKQLGRNRIESAIIDL
jgi:diguanylate cyclase (GGDEF)-like protein